VNINVIGLLGVALSIVAFQVTWLALRRRKLAARLAAALASAAMAIPALLFAAYYLHVLPEWEWFYTLRSWPGSELLAIFLGCAGGALAALLPRWLAVVPLFAAVALAVVPYVKPILGPLPDSIFSDNWRGDACLQSTASTCGPASVCTILRRLNVEVSERTAAHAAFSYTGGTEAWYLARYVRSHGFAARFRFGATFSPSFGLPAVVGVRLGGVGHFIAVLAVQGDEVTYADPLRGEEHTSLVQFQKRYVFTGFHMVVSKT
jgi:hypothetical protein